MALADFENSPEFSDLEKLALRYAAAITATPVEWEMICSTNCKRVSTPASW